MFAETSSVGACMCNTVCECVRVYFVTVFREKFLGVVSKKKNVRFCFCSGFLFICLRGKCKKNKKTSPLEFMC